jgi:ABC-type uncharacterized transport system ATPase subunit
LMYQGSLFMVGSPDMLRKGLPGQYLQVDCSQPEQAINALEGMDQVIEVSLHGAMLHVAVHDASARESVLARLAGVGIEVYQCEVGEPTLEDVFIASIRTKRLNNGAKTNEVETGGRSEPPLDH